MKFFKSSLLLLHQHLTHLHFCGVEWNSLLNVYMFHVLKLQIALFNIKLLLGYTFQRKQYYCQIYHMVSYSIVGKNEEEMDLEIDLELLFIT